MRCWISLPAGTLALFLAGPVAALSSATPTATLPPPLQLRADPNPARSGQLVTLIATRGLAHAAPRWTQIEGPPVSLTAADTLAPTFVAPGVAQRTTVAFRFGVVSDVQSQTIEVVVEPADAVAVVLPSVTVPPGSVAEIAVPVDALGFDVATLRTTIGFEAAAAVVARGDGTPDCDPAAGVDGSFRFLPSGCAGDTCTRLEASLQFAAPPAGAIAYRCRVRVGEQPADSCDHALACVDATAHTPNGAPLEVACADGSVIAMWSPPVAEFGIAIEPAVPRLGESTRLVFSVAHLGGIPHYTLLGGSPLLDTSSATPVFPAVGQVVYELPAVLAGTATVRLGVDSEVRGGCPGSEFFYFHYDLSPAFPLTVVDPNGVRIGGRIAALPGCQGARAGATVTLEPGGRMTTSGADGAFRFDGVSPGSYVVSLPEDCDRVGCVPPQAIVVRDTDLSLDLCPRSTACVGDCNLDRRVTIDELITAVDMALASTVDARCAVADIDGSGALQIDELVAAVAAALDGCPPPPDRTPTPSPTATP